MFFVVEFYIIYYVDHTACHDYMCLHCKQQGSRARMAYCFLNKVTYYSMWFGGFLMVQKVGEINQMNPLLFCLQKMRKTGLFHQLFEPLKIIFDGNLCFFSLFKQWSTGRGCHGHKYA